jgi:acetyltransferase-like isoleucine patch superfamily enzyme
MRWYERVNWVHWTARVSGEIAWGAHLLIRPPSELELGENSSIQHGTVIAVKSGPRGPGALRIGRGTTIGQYNNLRSEGDELRIGSRCLISQFVSLIATGHEYTDRSRLIAEQGVPTVGGLVIGDDVWIGAGAALMPGIRVGDGAVVAASSVVTHDVAAYAIVAGVPARQLGERVAERRG